MRRVIQHSVLLLAVALFIACSAGNDGLRAEVADVVFEAGATDEAWLEISEASLDTNPDFSAPELTQPTSLSHTSAPIFRWNGGSVASLDSNVSVRFASNHAKHSETVLDALVSNFSWLVTIPRANAHEPPVTGTMYRLIIQDSADEETRLRVLTGTNHYSARDEFWERFANSTEVTVELTGAFLADGRVEEGPFASTVTLSFE